MGKDSHVDPEFTVDLHVDLTRFNPNPSTNIPPCCDCH